MTADGSGGSRSGLHLTKRPSVLSFWALDPGGHIGWAWGWCVPSVLTTEDPSSFLLRRSNFWAGEEKGFDSARGIAAVWKRVRNSTSHLQKKGFEVFTVMGCEGFQVLPGAKNRSAGVPLRQLGALDLLRLQQPEVVQRYEEPEPAAKAVITDDRLKRWGMWNTGKKDANDACRHLVVLMRNFS